MKARLSLIAALLCLLLLCACGQEEEAAPEFQLPEGRHLQALTTEESQAMARFLNANRVLLDGNFLYCYDFDNGWRPVLGRYTWDGSGLKDFTVLAEGCVPEYLCRLGTLFTILSETAAGSSGCRCRAGRGSRCGRAHATGWSSGTGCFAFGTARDVFSRLTPSTGAAEESLLPRPCAWAYPLEGAILYLSAEESRLCLYWTEEAEEEALSPGPADTPLILGDCLYYRSGTALHRVGLDGEAPTSFSLPETDGAIELLPEAAGLRLRGIRDESGPVQWEGPPEGPFYRQARGYRICDWLGGGLRVDTVYEPDGRIRCFLLTADEGFQLSFLAGKTT